MFPSDHLLPDQLSCSRKRWKCVGLEESGGSAVLVGSATIKNLKENQGGRSTFIKLELPYSGAGAGLGDEDSYQDIDRCCPASNISQWDEFLRLSLLSRGKQIEQSHSDNSLIRGHPCPGLRAGPEQVQGGESGQV